MRLTLGTKSLTLAAHAVQGPLTTSCFSLMMTPEDVYLTGSFSKRYPAGVLVLETLMVQSDRFSQQPILQQQSNRHLQIHTRAVGSVDQTSIVVAILLDGMQQMR